MAVASTLVAIVLAGGPPDEVSALVPGATNKAFVPIAGRTLVERTLDALRSSPHVDRIVVVAPAVTRGAPALASADEFRPSGTTMSASLRAGLAGLGPDDLALVTAADLPVLSAAAIDEFIGLARAAGADIVYACVERRTHLARYPGVPHTWAHLREGSFCGGGVVAIRPRAIDRLDLFLDRLGAARKNPLRLAAIFGLPTLVRYALRRLSIDAAERRGSDLIGVRVAAARCERAEIAINVDRVSDIAVAERLAVR